MYVPRSSRIATTAASLCVSVASPVSGTSTSVTLPSSLTRGSAGAPRRGSSAISAVSVSSPCCTSGSSGVPRIASCAGAFAPDFGKYSTRARNACLVWMSSGSVVMPDRPCLIPRPSSSGWGCSQNGSDRTIRKLAESTRLITGRAMTARLARSQKPPGRPCSIWPCRMRRESHDDSLRSQRVRTDGGRDEPEETRQRRRDHRVLRRADAIVATAPATTIMPRSARAFAILDIHGQSSQSDPTRLAGVPSRLRTAGRSVIDAATETSTTMMAPPARPRKIVVGTRSMPESAITTVRPLKKTARFAVAPERPIARSLSPPFRRSSRYRDTMNNE